MNGYQAHFVPEDSNYTTKMLHISKIFQLNGNCLEWFEKYSSSLHSTFNLIEQCDLRTILQTPNAK